MSTTATDNAALVKAGYGAFASGDMQLLSEVFADAAWNHRNPDRFGGIKRGFDEIGAFFGESAQLTEGTLKVEPKAVLADGDTVAVIARMSGTRPDGRQLDDMQVHVFTIRDGRAATVDQYVGDPEAVAAFWA
jgi:ketosteroid isomerase-like protein